MFSRFKGGTTQIRQALNVSVAGKLFIGVLTVNLLVIILIVAVIGWNLREGFAAYITQTNLDRQRNLISRLEALYKVDGNWSALQKAPQRWNEIVRTSGWSLTPSEENLSPANEPVPLPQRETRSSSLSPQPSSPPMPQDRPHGPPPQAYEDCLGKAPGTLVMHRTPGGIVPATCEASPEGMVARPNQDHRPRPQPLSQDQRPAPAPAPVRLADQLSLFDSQDQWIAGHLPIASERVVSIDLRGTNGQRIGKLSLLIPKQATSQDQTFIDYCMQILMIAALCALLLSILAAFILSRNFVSILRRLADGAQKLASGRYDTRIAGERSDEFGDLIKDFNRLAVSLEQHEQSRRLWVAQTSHELRTPIAVLRAHIEALIDGVRAVNPSELELLHREVIRIGKLITDLHELSRADSGSLAFRKEPVELLSIIEEMIGAFHERCAQKSLAITFRRHGNVMLFADQDRIRQVLANLFENSLRYTDSPGMIQIRYTLDPTMITLVFEDSAPGVSMSALADLFDPFYRTDESRQRQTGGSGLGLAIVRAIIVAHDGTIQASPSSLGGLAVTMCLPIIDKRHAQD